MKMRMPPQGYTVVEALIFLAISAALFASAVSLMSGQQNKTEFIQAVYEVDSQLQDVINDIATGYYTNTNNFTCDAPAGSGAPIITSPATGTQGGNKNCIYLGRALQFAISGTNNTFNVYTVVGRRQYQLAPPKEVKDYDSAQPVMINHTINAEKKTLQNSLTIHSVSFEDTAGVSQPIGAFGFLSTFGQYDPLAPARLVSGDQAIELVPFPSTSLNQAEITGSYAINNSLNAQKNPPKGIRLCFNSGTTKQYAIITIGSNGRQLTTKVEIKAGNC